MKVYWPTASCDWSRRRCRAATAGERVAPDRRTDKQITTSLWRAWRTWREDSDGKKRRCPHVIGITRDWRVHLGRRGYLHRTFLRTPVCFLTFNARHPPPYSFISFPFPSFTFRSLRSAVRDDLAFSFSVQRYSAVWHLSPLPHLFAGCLCSWRSPTPHPFIKPPLPTGHLVITV